MLSAGSVLFVWNSWRRLDCFHLFMLDISKVTLLVLSFELFMQLLTFHGNFILSKKKKEETLMSFKYNFFFISE
jgi:hypothetical protein